MFTRRQLRFSILPLAVLTLTLWASPAGAQNTDLFNNFNVASIAGPNAPIFNPVFTLPGAARISELVTYHWNNGKGATPGTISLRDQTNRVYGPFAARGVSGQGGAANVNWVASVNLIVPAGTFIVFDSDPGTWSRNAQPPSFYRGFVIVRGQLLQGAAPLPGPLPGPRPPAPSACPSAYPNCTCRGVGCVHPDLTAFGGNGPLGTTVPRRIHLSVNPQQFYGFWLLTPTTTVAMLQQRCSQVRPVAGRLVLLDDEPWYYYYTGYYARFGCGR